MRLRRLGGSAAGQPQIQVLGCERGLNEAYNLTERAQPDLVVITADQVMLPEFPMYAAMLDILQVDCLVLADPGDAAGLGDIAYDTAGSAELERHGGLGPWLVARFGLSQSAIQAPSRAVRPSQRAQMPSAIAAATDPAGGGEAWKTVVIGASTGGIEALLEVLSHFAADCPPTLVVQHISATFLPGFAQRLDRHCAADVLLARQNAEFRPGQVLLAPGNSEHLTIVPPGKRCRLVAGDPVSGHRPSVDALFHSAARLGGDVVGVILTGMGRDGAEGLAAIRRAGGRTIGQSAATCTVYGMPRAAFELGAVEQQLDLVRIGPAILSAASRTVKEPVHARR